MERPFVGLGGVPLLPRGNSEAAMKCQLSAKGQNPALSSCERLLRLLLPLATGLRNEALSYDFGRLVQ
jgi:hypothetical protein